LVRIEKSSIDVHSFALVKEAGQANAYPA